MSRVYVYERSVKDFSGPSPEHLSELSPQDLILLVI